MQFACQSQKTAFVVTVDAFSPRGDGEGRLLTRSEFVSSLAQSSIGFTV